MGPPWQAMNRRRRTRDCPEHACVQTHFSGQGGTCRGGRLKERSVVVPSSRRGKNLQCVAKEGEPWLPQKGKWSPRGTGNRQAPPIQASLVSVAVRGAPG